MIKISTLLYPFYALVPFYWYECMKNIWNTNMKNLLLYIVLFSWQFSLKYEITLLIWIIAFWSSPHASAKFKKHSVFVLNALKYFSQYLTLFIPFNLYIHKTIYTYTYVQSSPSYPPSYNPQTHIIRTMFPM